MQYREPGCPVSLRFNIYEKTCFLKWYSCGCWSHLIDSLSVNHHRTSVSRHCQHVETCVVKWEHRCCFHLFFSRNNYPNNNFPLILIVFIVLLIGRQFPNLPYVAYSPWGQNWLHTPRLRRGKLGRRRRWRRRKRGAEEEKKWCCSKIQCPTADSRS